MTVAPGGVPTQLKVTITATVDNFFAKSFGVDTSRITREAVADYNGPAPMGNPCNAFGNEPKGTTKAGPTDSQLSVPLGAQCPVIPDFWASINGPDIDKTQGERFAARQCAGNEDGCNSSDVNIEFDPLGYFYSLRVVTPGVPVTIQVYDPASVPTGQQCEARPKWSNTAANNANDWTPDARKRYGFPTNNDATMCPGDNDMKSTSSESSEQATVTSFGLRGPTATQVPAQGSPIMTCAKQFRGYKQSEVTSAALTKGGASYQDGLASVFHQWNTLCTFTPAVAGEYYLQVRSNVKFSGTSTDTSSSGNTNIFSQVTDDTAVKGTAVNSFGLRAYSASGNVSISAFKKMRIFVNGANAQTTFNLVRIVPAAKGKTLNFGFFDVGEGAVGSSYMKIVPPADSNVSSASGCVATGYKNEDAPNCQLAISTSFNGKQQNMRMPIPSTYTCNYASQGGAGGGLSSTSVDPTACTTPPRGRLTSSASRSDSSNRSLLSSNLQRNADVEVIIGPQPDDRESSRARTTVGRPRLLWTSNFPNGDRGRAEDLARDFATSEWRPVDRVRAQPTQLLLRPAPVARP